MKSLRFLPIIFLFLGITSYSNIAHAKDEDPNSYKVLGSSNKKLSIANIEAYITEGDKFIEKGDFEKAKTSYDKARDLARQLSGFYRDLNLSFDGIFKVQFT